MPSGEKCLKLFAAGGFHAAVAAGKFLHAAGGIDKFLFASEEGVAIGADADFDVLAGRTGMVNGAARASNGGFRVIGMDFRFHFWGENNGGIGRGMQVGIRKNWMVREKMDKVIVFWELALHLDGGWIFLEFWRDFF